MNRLTPKLFWWTCMGCGALATIGPFWVMVSTSLMTKAQVFQFPPALIPMPVTWHNYGQVFAQVPFLTYFLNSLLVATLTTAGQVLFCAMAAYAFSRLHFPFKNGLFFMVLITMMIPPQVNIVPLFFVMKSFGWIDTYAGLIVPGLFGAFGVFLLRQWFNGLPLELEEAARLDGCNPWQVFVTVALPLARPALAALGILAFIGSWNSFMWPLIVVQSEGLSTLPVGIAALQSSYRDVTDWGVLMAASTLSVLPVIMLFLVGQKQFVEGLLQGSVKE
ncbi:MAG: carbohydrate ABC transporter permease [Cyanobacteria bacterium HKST-UBA03]|nr:carbohydrate ABC transporter permease [Cyanobacteria bacterium HKST-UBA03]